MSVISFIPHSSRQEADATILMKELGTREVPARERCTLRRSARPAVKGTAAKLPMRSRVRTSQRPGVWVCRASEEKTPIPKRPSEAKLYNPSWGRGG